MNRPWRKRLWWSWSAINCRKRAIIYQIESQNSKPKLRDSSRWKMRKERRKSKSSSSKPPLASQTTPGRTHYCRVTSMISSRIWPRGCLLKLIARVWRMWRFTLGSNSWRLWAMIAPGRSGTCSRTGRLWCQERGIKIGSVGLTSTRLAPISPPLLETKLLKFGTLLTLAARALSSNISSLSGQLNSTILEISCSLRVWIPRLNCMTCDLKKCVSATEATLILSIMWISSHLRISSPLAQRTKPSRFGTCAPRWLCRRFTAIWVRWMTRTSQWAVRCWLPAIVMEFWKCGISGLCRSCSSWI